MDSNHELKLSETSLSLITSKTQAVKEWTV